MRGKYSPTVSAAYVRDSEWFTKYCFCVINSSEYSHYDPEGYDYYGYNEYDIDRAGNEESEYYSNDYDDLNDGNFKYDNALGEWTFDGVKPVRR